MTNIKLKPGERLANQVLENTVIDVSAPEVALSNLRLIDCAVTGRNPHRANFENLHFVGGRKDFDASIKLFGGTMVRMSDISGVGVQRMVLVNLNHSVPQFSGVIDGVHCREFRDHFGQPDRSEAICFHGYNFNDSATPLWVDVEVRNVVVDDWPASWLTFWNTGIERALVKECPSVQGPVQIGWSKVFQPCKRLEINSVNSDNPTLLYRTYDPMIGPEAIGDIQTPDGWRHELWNGGGKQPDRLGRFDNAAGVRNYLKAVA